MQLDEDVLPQPWLDLSESGVMWHGYPLASLPFII
jgi:hypothetical protein